MNKVIFQSTSGEHYDLYGSTLGLAWQTVIHQSLSLERCSMEAGNQSNMME
jgi:hypothetical protein